MKVFCLVLAGFLAACGDYHQQYDTSSSNNAQSINTFESLQADVLEPQCSSCHGPGTLDAGLDVTSYTSILNVVKAGSPSQSALYTEVSSGGMPAAGQPLSAGEVQAIADWINAGAPNGSFGRTPTSPPPPMPPPTPPPPAVASFKEVQTNIFNQSCTGCHSGNSPSGGVNLTTYALMMANAKHVVIAGSSATSLVYTEIKSGNMPPGKTKVSASDQTLLANWIDQGAKNN